MATSTDRPKLKSLPGLPAFRLLVSWLIYGSLNSYLLQVGEPGTRFAFASYSGALGNSYLDLLATGGGDVDSNLGLVDVGDYTAHSEGT